MGSNSKSTQFAAAHTKIMNLKRELVTLTKISETLDTEGRVTASSETSDTDVKVIIKSLREEDRKLIGRGKSIEGYMKMFANPSYDLTNLGDDTTIEVGDKVTRGTAFDSDVYVVEEVVGRMPMYGSEIYRLLLIRRVDA